MRVMDSMDSAVHFDVHNVDSAVIIVKIVAIGAEPQILELQQLLYARTRQ